MSVKITDTAIKRFAELAQNQPGYPRIEIRAGGCNGFEKIFSWTESTDSDDIVIDTQPGKVVIDTVSYELLTNATVDFRTDISGSYFSIEIPEAASECGCGASFSL